MQLRRWRRTLVDEHEGAEERSATRRSPPRAQQHFPRVLEHTPPPEEQHRDQVQSSVDREHPPEYQYKPLEIRERM